jgi:hypothetical protein
MQTFVARASSQPGKHTTGEGHRPSATTAVAEGLRSPSRPLDPATRSYFESRLRYNFADVRVHAESRAARSAAEMGAAAYTVGRDIVFGAGRYEPLTPAGRQLLGHELTHTVQQAGQVAAHAGTIGVLAPDSGAERAADMASRAVSAGRTVSVDPAPVGVARQVVNPATGGEPGGPPGGGVRAIGGVPGESGQQAAPGEELIKPDAGADATPVSSSGGGGGDPSSFPDRSFWMGGRMVDHWLAGRTLGANHTYVNVKQDATNYWLVEAGPLPSDPHTVGAWAKAHVWEGHGNRIGTTYPDRTSFDRARTALFEAQKTYHSSSIKYDHTNGPNSNSFVEHMTTKAPFYTIFTPFDWQWDYWRSHPRPF